ncbi:MAG: ParA family protein [Candidatus Eisenbacteria bacterium]|nr:ParA family protein [Candidatus Eisenbacteria bacterium]
MRSYAIANIKGGSGKTTIAVNLAAGLALAGRNVVLFDLDPQGSSSFHLLPRSCNGNLADSLAGEKRLADVLTSTLVTGLTIAPGNRMLAPFDNGAHPTRERLANLVGQVDPEIDYVLIDTPPTWGSLLVASLSSVDGVIVPVTTRELDLQILGLLIEVVEQVQRHRNPRLRIAGIVPNRTVRTRLSGKVEATLREVYGASVLPPIRENARLAEAGGFHAPIQVTAPGSSGAEDFSELVKAFLDKEERPF